MQTHLHQPSTVDVDTFVSTFICTSAEQTLAVFRIPMSFFQFFESGFYVGMKFWIPSCNMFQQRGEFMIRKWNITATIFRETSCASHCCKTLMFICMSSMRSFCSGCLLRIVLKSCKIKPTRWSVGRSVFCSSNRNVIRLVVDVQWRKTASNVASCHYRSACFRWLSFLFQIFRPYMNSN